MFDFAEGDDMGEQRIEWAGVPFLPFSHHDGRMLRAPGLYGFVRRGPGDERVLLYVDHADCIATTAVQSHPLWGQALSLGMNELHVCLKAKERLDRLQLRHHLIKRAEPILNLFEEQQGEMGAPAPLSLWASQRR